MTVSPLTVALMAVIVCVMLAMLIHDWMIKRRSKHPRKVGSLTSHYREMGK